MIYKICFTALLWLAIALMPIHSAFAASVSVPNNNARQAANAVVQDTGAKQQFGKSENGDRLLEQAQQKANKKLDNLAQKADSAKELPTSEKLFLDNLTNID